MSRRSLTTRLGGSAARRIVGGAAACAVVTAALAGCGGSSSKDAYDVRAIFQSAPFVISGLDVRIAGVKVGSVKSVDLTDDNQAAVTLSITDPGFKDFRQDAFCRVRPQALIGERYVECTLTDPHPAGATAPPPLPKIANGPYKGEHLLPISNTAVSIDSDEVLAVNTASVREKLGIIVRELGTGVAGRGEEIQTALTKGNEALTNTNIVLKQLAGQTDMLKQLADSSDQTLQVLASERSALTGTVEHGATVVGTLARRETELKASITQLNNLLTEVKPTADRATDLADQLTPIADDINRSSTDIATVLNLLPTVASRGTTAVNSLGPTVKRAREVLTSPQTNALFDRLVKTSGAVKASGAVLGLTLGDFRTAGGLDYFLNTIYGLAYATNGRDASGNYLRGATFSLLSCILPSSESATSKCGVPLSADNEASAPASAAEGARVSAEQTASAAKVKSVTPTRTPKAETAATSPKPTPSATPTTTSVDEKSASLLLGGTQ